MGGHFFGWHPLTPQVSNWVQFAFATPVVLWAGWPFFVRGAQSIATRNLNMFTLIAIGIGVAWIASVVATFAPWVFPPAFQGHGGAVATYFEAAAVITVLVLVGQVLELRARERTSGAIRALLDQAPKTAISVTDHGDAVVALDTIAVGDKLRVRPGDKVPVDGELIEGPFDPRRVGGDRRVDAGRQDGRRQGDRRHHQPQRRLRHARRGGRPRHHAVADRADGGERATLARAGAAARRPGRRMVRAGGDAGRGAGVLGLGHASGRSRATPTAWSRR